MTKKIYDIMPPKDLPSKAGESKIIKKPEGDSGVLPIKIVKEPVLQDLNVMPSSNDLQNKGIDNLVNTQKHKTEKLNKEPKQKTKKKLSFKVWLGIIAGVLLLIICVYFYFSLQKADIVIYPKTDVLSFNGKITVDKSINAIDQDNSLIPAKIFESDQDLWQDFPATGTSKNEGKASGTIKVYNKLNPASPFILKSGTHFLSDSGKYFVTLKMITVPAATFKGSKLVLGSVSVQVVAEKPGKDSNIDASKFSIPKLSGTAYYYNIYGESTVSMSGGYSGQVKQVTDNDLSDAKNSLSKKVLDLALSDLKSKVPSDYVLFDNAISNNVIEAFSPVKSGATVDSFNYQVKVKAQALAFKRQDIEKFARSKISSNLSQKTILDESFKINFTPDSIDLNVGKIILNSDFSARIYQPIDTNDLLSLIKEKSALEIKSVIDSRLQGQIDKEIINFWPFWTTSAPSDASKIKVELKF